MASSTKTLPKPVASCLGIDVPDSPFLHEKRIARINAAKYEGQEIRGGLHVVREGDNVLELGAGIGIVGAVVSKNRKPKKGPVIRGKPGADAAHQYALQDEQADPAQHGQE